MQNGHHFRPKRRRRLCLWCFFLFDGFSEAAAAKLLTAVTEVRQAVDGLGERKANVFVGRAAQASAVVWPALLGSVIVPPAGRSSVFSTPNFITTFATLSDVHTHQRLLMNAVVYWWLVDTGRKRFIRQQGVSEVDKDEVLKE